MYVLSTPSTHNINDFPTYWLAAKALLAGQNPYGAVETHLFFRIPQGAQPLIPLNPPWALPFMLPLGWFSLHDAAFLWLILSIVQIWTAVIWLSELYLPDRKLGTTTLLAFTFLPIPALFLFGQSVGWVLLGIAGFLRYESKEWVLSERGEAYESRRPYLAGAFLLFATFKPHLVFLIWPALLLSAIIQKQWKLFIGFMAALVVDTGLVVLMRPRIFLDYLNMMLDRHISSYPLPALSFFLKGYRLEFLPIVLAIIWFAFKWEPGNWKEQTPMLILVSLIASPYAFFYDQVLLLPALFDGYSYIRRGPAIPTYWAANLSVLIVFFIHRGSLLSGWTLPVWLLLYAAVRYNGASLAADPAVN